MTKRNFCPSATGTTYDRKSKVFRPRRCKTRSCNYCRVIRSYRILLQIREEQILSYSLVENLRPYRRRLERKGLSYISFPTPTGHIVISALGEHMLLGDIADQIALWIENSPPGKNISASRGFGGEHSGCRPKPERDRYVHSELDLGTILHNLKDVLGKRREEEDDAIERAETSPFEEVLLSVVQEEDVTEAME